MRLVVDKKGVFWQIDKRNCFVVYPDSVPLDAVIIQAEFDGFLATTQQFESVLGIRNYNMRIASQTTTYKLTMTELKNIFAKELSVSESRITLKFDTYEEDDAEVEIVGVEVIVQGQIPTTE